MEAVKIKFQEIWKKYNSLCSWILTGIVLYVAYLLCSVIFHLTWIDNDAPVVFVLAVAIISRLTHRIYYGIVASLVSTYVINYFFTYPYYYFTLSIKGYTIDFICFMAVSFLVSILTYQLRGETEKVMQHEKETIELYRRNQKLEEKRAAAELATEKEKMHSNLLRAVSHDLRTPLTAIAGTSSILMQKGDVLSPVERKKLAANIQEESLWLSQMVENLLSVTRFREGEEVRLKEREELVEEVLEESVTKFHRRFPDQQVAVQAPSEILMVPMDAMLIEQVLLNLMENAVRHSGAKDVIEVNAWRENDKVWFSVRDHGHGIAEEDFPGLFSGELHTTDATRGMGIGLSACRSILLAHRGKLSATNHPTGGAEFRFWLPAGENRTEEMSDNEYETAGDGSRG